MLHISYIALSKHRLNNTRL